MALLDIFGTAILPVVAVAAVGFLLARVRDVRADGLNAVTVYVLAPALVFHSIATTPLVAETLLWVALGVAAFTVAMVVVAELLGRALGEREPLLSAFVLAAAFSNSGNYGLPLSEFAFGATGRSTAAIFLTAQGVLLYTLGAYVAARSSGDAGRSGLRRVLSVPLVYAAVGALVLRWIDLVPPQSSAVMATVGSVGDAAIPVMLLVLGVELANTDYAAAVSSVTRPVAVKMAVAPVVGVGVALAVTALGGFEDPVVARTFVLETATPTAVTPLVLVVEFGDDATIGGVSATQYVGTAIFVSTLVSVPVLTAVIALLQAGLIL